jgi:hypothetical protein
VVLVREGHGVGIEVCDSPDATLTYSGQEVQVDFGAEYGMETTAQAIA